ncbi:MAG: hypothetical protein JSS62_05950 [Verrucomicrobia bacterium]|nr:hypothetical protein [Verrucomicrobiota bacterium]MBS0647108.1 hypothetical protein [Verrucomicrobiota bacterium]
MQKILIICTFVTSSLFALPSDIKNDEELLFARRIIEFWRDHDRTFIQNQIENFLSQYPESEFTDHFYAILADIFIEQRDFERALASYSLIKNTEIINRVRIKRWYALYQLHHYTQLYYEIAPQLAFVQEEEGIFYYAEAALREALNLKDLPEQELQQHMLLETALDAYSKLQKSERFSGNAQLAMAEIYRYLGHLDQAAKLYYAIAQEQKNPQILYRAATLLALCDETKALDLFARLAKGGGTRAAEAAYQWLQLLAKTKQWSVLKKERRCFLSTLTEPHLCIYHFYLGMLTYEEGHYQEASEPLKQSLVLGLKPPHDRNAATALLICAREMMSPETAEYAYNVIKERYPEDIEEASLTRGICYRKAGQLDLASEMLSHIITMGHSLPILETAYLEDIQLLTDQHKWEDAHNRIQEFLNRFPLSLQRLNMLRLAVELSLADLSSTHHYTQLACDLQQALSIPNLYTPSETLEYRLLLAKCYVNLANYPASLVLLNELVQEGLQSAEIHYLFTLSLLQTNGTPEQIIEHGEKVLTMDPQFYEINRLHLYLFNAYLELSCKLHNDAYAQQAADHLFSVIDHLPISLENQLWLAHTYAKQPSQLSRARHILERILLGNKEKMHKLHPEVLLLASIYQQTGAPLKALDLLEPLYQSNPSLNTCLCLASTHKDLGHYQKAFLLFKSLESCSDIQIALSAQLENARLVLSHPEVEGNSQQALQTLKDLWVQKSLVSEPIHLEAALDYIDFYTRTHPKESQLTLLRSIKDHFTSERDICSKDYHESRRGLYEKDRLYQSYMRLLDAKICLAEANELKLSSQEAESKKKAAHALFSTLLQGKYAQTAYITQKARLEVN